MLPRLFALMAFAILFAVPDAGAASTLTLSLKDANTLAVKFKNHTLNLKAKKPWKTTKEGGDTYYVVKADIEFGQVKLFESEAKVGKAGGSFKVSVAPSFSKLSISAGSFEFSLLPGDVIKDAPSNAEFKKDELVMLASVNNAITLSVGDNASFTVPDTGGTAATMMIEFNKGTFYYEGPVPAIEELLNGIDALIEASAEQPTQAGFGYSASGAFKYVSSKPLYSGEFKQETEKFSCNVVLNGAFDIAETIAVSSDICINTDAGKLGVNGALTYSAEVLKTDAEFTVGEGSVAIDKKGVRFGFGKTKPKLGKKLENILFFIDPMLIADGSVYGYATNKKKFGLILDLNNILQINGVQFRNLHLGMTTSGLDVAAELKSANLGTAKVEGRVTDTKCWLDFKAKSKLFGYSLDAPRVSPCQARKGAVEYAGKLAILGKNLAVKGLDEVNKQGQATLDAAENLTFKVGKLTLNAGKMAYDTSKKGLKLAESKLAAVSHLGDFSFGDLHLNTSGWLATDVKTTKKYGYNKKLSISGGSVRLTGDGEVEAALLAKNGAIDVSGHLKSRTKAKFCVKVKVAGHKTSKCDSIHIDVNQGMELSSGCFRVSGSKKILGTKFSIPNKDICLGKDKDADDPFHPDQDSVGVVVYLQAYNGKYVWPDKGGDTNVTHATGDNPEKSATFIMYHQVKGKDQKEDSCPVYGANVSFLTYNENRQDRYLRLDKKTNPVDSKATHANSAEQVILESVDGKKSGDCITDGDKVRLKSDAHGTYWTVQRDQNFQLYGQPKLSGSSAAHQEYTIHMDAGS